jgi:hypothetical protein
MNFKVKKTKDKQETTYKTIYIRQSLVDRINKIATENNTSFNNVVISMIEACLEDDGE